MEARIGRESLHFYGMASPDLRVLGKRPVEWDLNDWRWDGDLFIASPLNRLPSHGVSQQLFPLVSGIPENGRSSNSSSSCSDEASLGIDKGKREFDKKRRAFVVEDDSANEETGNLTLKLGGHNYPPADKEVANWDRSTGKKTKLVGGTSNRSVCQVEDCGADLSKAKDYHRRHKVCEMHSKASRALVANVMQRFCQQCSRFHVLQEFDEGKRSCRRRLAGHNKRRRKTNIETVPSGSSPNDDQTSSYLLINVLRILSNMHANKSDKTGDQDLLSHLLKSFANQNGDHGAKNISSLMLEPQNLLKDSTSAGKSDMASTLVSNCSQDPPSLLRKQQTVPLSEAQCGDDSRNADTGAIPHTKTSVLGSLSDYSEVRESPSAQMKMNNFDLNDIYIDSDDGIEDVERSPATANMGTSFVDYTWAQDSHQSSPPQTSGNSDSASALSPSSSSGEALSRTDRIVFKLFGKEPNDFPPFLRAQMLDWLSHSPTDIESYIRPGCIILTMYLHQSEAAWEELYADLSSSLKRLVHVSDNDFWRKGWIFIRLQHQIAFILNGQVVLDSYLPFTAGNHSKIVSVRPIAVSPCEKAQFTVKGINLIQPATCLVCALEGKYLVREATHESTEAAVCSEEFDELQSIKFSCSIPVTNGRGFVEIEEQSLSSSFFPFLVVEENVCSEICVLEDLLESDDSNADMEVAGKLEAKNEAMEFIHEMGWLLHRSQLKSRLSNLNLNAELFPLKRFKWLMEFSVDHDWCAVVQKLLSILLNGTVGTGEHPSLYRALSDIGLLHRAVRKNSRRLVELLLTYVPENISEILGPEDKALLDGVDRRYLFRPDAVGPAGLTPLHIAAGKDGSEDVIDALTEDPDMVGIEAWKNARDTTGSTPEDYARLRGHYSYIRLVQKKINRSQGVGHVVLEIPSDVTDVGNVSCKENESIAGFEIGNATQKYPNGQCKLCDHRWTQRIAGGRFLVYRPAMLSMVTVAAVCVCVALLFKSAPEVLYPFRPFSWESLDYGTI